MRLSLIVLAFVSLVVCSKAYPQPPEIKTLALQFVPKMGGKMLALSDAMQGPGAEGLDITILRFYISGIELYDADALVWKEAERYHLLDAAQTETMSIKLHPPAGLKYDKIIFYLGVDSATSCSGVHAGDLDPVKGMYWAWQSGYVNFKLEGFSKASTARKHAFQFHLGGYRAPYSALQRIVLSVKASHTIMVKMDISRFLTGIDLARQHSIMTPGAEAASLSAKASRIFSIAR